jgi:hypothetical protein
MDPELHLNLEFAYKRMCRFYPAIQSAFSHPLPIVHVGPLDDDKCGTSG